ncbi:DUF6154 family protein [Calidifontibacillus erzurumensis]|uniref:Cytosolic protein n=1 Tax=Calidifontibacillus erzurumensis TaxID=2741433 RepID=A0A8J8GCW2_9BACI|nr:DUF6154 family protein [Calidifontibacillus erzurumensis]NSL51362.1 cytosolic protein [Calidifontibacillus erzurumensis]
MKLIDDLYNLYKHMLTGDEEDADIIVFSVLEAMDRKDLLELIAEMNDEELYSMVGMYMIEKFKSKMAQDGIEQNEIRSVPELKNLH